MTRIIMFTAIAVVLLCKSGVVLSTECDQSQINQCPSVMRVREMREYRLSMIIKSLIQDLGEQCIDVCNPPDIKDLASQQKYRIIRRGMLVVERLLNSTGMSDEASDMRSYVDMYLDEERHESDSSNEESTTTDDSAHTDDSTSTDDSTTGSGDLDADLGDILCNIVLNFITTVIHMVNECLDSYSHIIFFIQYRCLVHSIFRGLQGAFEPLLIP